jgi:hypothetical protein
VRFIKDENLEAITSWSENRTFTQVAGIFDAVMAGCVNLNNV